MPLPLLAPKEWTPNLKQFGLAQLDLQMRKHVFRYEKLLPLYTYN